MVNVNIPQATYEYAPTSTNMVQVVESIIDGYKMGPIRALAQEPVQNSKDAKNATTVYVEYRLHHRGELGYMLTVTDTGTTGLGGPVIAQEDVTSGVLVLPQGHDWAAFEGQGYTKANEDALGSRGQGKSAFLYHSSVEQEPKPRRMAILYDTLLSSGEYRLGVRYARPGDAVRRPPILGNEARQLIQGNEFQIDPDLAYPLELPPLEDVGTRIIVPFLSVDAVEAFRNGELAKWLQMLWWRAIQVGDLQIKVIDAQGDERFIDVPHWWKDEPWKTEHLKENTYFVEHRALSQDPHYKIKRLVLLHDPSLEEHVHLYDRKEPEFDGIQIMRRSQWIETLSTRLEYGRLIPQEYRKGFRGFVEFDQNLDRTLRGPSYERPQHDDFIRRTSLVQDILSEIESHVEKFSRIRGWLDGEESAKIAQESEQNALRRVLRVFMSPTSANDGSHDVPDAGKTTWRVRIDASYPNPDTTRIDWGQVLRAVTVKCESTPAIKYQNLNLVLATTYPDGTQSTILSREFKLDGQGVGLLQLGDFPILKGGLDSQHLHCEVEGKYNLKAIILLDDIEVTVARCVFYVGQDPPINTDVTPITVLIEALNENDPSRRRINHGENLRVRVALKNRTSKDIVVAADVVLVATELPSYMLAGEDAPESLVLMNPSDVTLPGTPHGATPVPVDLFTTSIRLFGRPQEGFANPFMVLAPGRHRLALDIEEIDGDSQISRSRFVYFEVDPPGAGGSLPFELHRRDDEDATEAWPSWYMERIDDSDNYAIFYYGKHHIYDLARAADRAGKDTRGTEAFVAEITCDALIDWAYEDYKNGEGKPPKHDRARSRTGRNGNFTKKI